MPILFFAFWIVLNGRITWEIAIFGVVLTAALSWFCVRFLDYSLRKEWGMLRRLPALARYFVTLVKEIFKANFTIIPIVYNRKREIKPQLITFHTPLQSALTRNVLADSITVTPGTITVTSEEGDLTVHCLDECFAEGIEDLDFQKQLLKLEGEARKA